MGEGEGEGEGWGWGQGARALATSMSLMSASPSHLIMSVLSSSGIVSMFLCTKPSVV